MMDGRWSGSLRLSWRSSLSQRLRRGRADLRMTGDTRDLITAVHRRMSIHPDVLGSSRCASLLRAATTSNARRSRVPPGTLLDQLSTFVCRRVNPPMEARPHPSLTDLGASSEGQLTSFTAALAVMERSEHDPHRSNSSRLQSFRFRLAIADIGTIAPRFPRRPPRTEPSLPDGHYRRLSTSASMERRSASLRPILGSALISSNAFVISFTVASEFTAQCETSIARAPA
jgi:hypothetical protein